MTELCFAEFVRCLQSAMQPPNDDKDIVELLLGWITEKASVVDRKGNSINIAPSLISDLLKRKVDVPKAIKNACTTKQIIADAQKHCETKIIPYMNAITSDDMFEAIEKIMELYASTPKQVFIAMDKEGSYTPKAQKIMEDNKVLQLNADEGALFGRTWNDVEVENN